LPFGHLLGHVMEVTMFFKSECAVSAYWLKILIYVDYKLQLQHSFMCTAC